MQKCCVPNCATRFKSRFKSVVTGGSVQKPVYLYRPRYVLFQGLYFFGRPRKGDGHGRGIFTALREDKNLHHVTVLSNFCIRNPPPPKKKKRYHQLLCSLVQTFKHFKAERFRDVYVQSGSLLLFSTAKDSMSIPSLNWSPYLMM